MQCSNCGKIIVDETSSYCNNCGARLVGNSKTNGSEGRSSFGFAVLGFFIPVVGFLLFLIYEGKKPNRAKSAGKGALIGFISRIVLSIILVVLYVGFATSLLGSTSDDFGSNIYAAFGGVIREETTDEILEKYVDVSFGEFKVMNNGYSSKTLLNITVKNKATKQCSYNITIEAVDANGTRIETDMIYADRLGAGQDVHLTAFEYVDQEKLNQFKNAAFRVLEINKYDF